MEKENLKKRVIIFSRNSPGPTNFYDSLENKFLDDKITLHLVDCGVAEIKHVEKIPYIVLLHVASGRFYDTTRSICISETEAKKLTDSNVATLKIVMSDHNFVCEEAEEQFVNESSQFITGDSERTKRENEKEKLKEKLLIGTTAAAGTTAVAAGAASVPFAMGFTSAGVAAGSAAAAIQSGIGSVAAGSGFAVMQSIAATTVIGTALPIAVAGVAAAGTVTAGVFLHKHLKKKNQRRASVKEEEAKLRMVELDDADEDTLEDDNERPVKLHGAVRKPPDYEDPPPYTP